MNNNACNFYAVLTDGSIRKVNLSQDITSEVREAFIEHAWNLSADGFEQIEFDGNYILQDGEIFFVTLEMDATIAEAVSDAFGVPELNLETDIVKTLFWVEDEIYYFQNFDARKLLTNKKVFYYSDNTYHKLDSNAFIVGDNIDGMYKDQNFFFYSYRNGNRIFSLLSFYKEATDADISEFSTHELISIDAAWLLNNSDTIIRKQITLIRQAGTLDNIDPNKLSRKANRFNLRIELENGKIKFPCNKKECKDILNFINEQYYIGAITGTKYITNSKRPIQ